MKNQENNEINLLLGKGFQFQTVLFGKPKMWRTKKMTLGRLIEISKIALKITTKDISENPISGFYNSVLDNAKFCAEVMATSVTDNKILRYFLTRHFLKNISAKELLDFANKRFQQSDYQNFIISTELMKADRITKPSPVEKQSTTV